MRIVNPTFGLPGEAAEEAASTGPAPTAWLSDPIAIISNAKPNALELLEGLRRKMGTFRATDNIDYLSKDSAAQPAPPELIDRVAANYRGAILALAD